MNSKELKEHYKKKICGFCQEEIEKGKPHFSCLKPSEASKFVNAEDYEFKSQSQSKREAQFEQIPELKKKKINYQCLSTW